MTRKWTLILVLLILLALACGNSNSGGGSSGSSSGGDEAEAPAAEAQAFKVGEDVTVGKIRWKFLEVEDIGQELKSDNEFIEGKTTSGKFVRVKFELENQGTDPASYTGIDLVDDKGRTFKPYDERISFVEQSELCILEQVNPGLSKTCTEIFELPADAAGVKASVGDLAPFGDDAVIDLGM
jgi:hypothetical protein